jgi:hypothetical protein
MIVTLEERLPEVVAKEELTVEEVDSKLVTLVLKLPLAVAYEELTTANELEAEVKVLMLVSLVVTLVLKLAEEAA